MPSSSDYGASGDDVQLVPAALTAYRHFYMYMGRLSGPQFALHSMNHGIPYPRDVQVHRAQCKKNQLIAQPAWLNAALADVSGPPPAHESPDPKCQCGFYAHYDPDGDFYQGQSWDVEKIVRGGVSSNEWGFWSNGSYSTDDFHPGSGYRAGSDDEYEGYVPVRAVVELTGRVVVGALGVRAAKMKILAFAVDWAKHYPVSPSPETDYGYPSYFIQGRPGGSDILVRGWTGNIGMDPDAKAAVISKSLEVGRRYGVKVYDTAEEMHAAHPKPDLSALGIEKAEPKPSAIDAYRNAMSKLQQFNYQVTVTTNQVDAFARAVLGRGYPTTTATAAPPAGTTYGPLTRKEALLEAKRNRPAPPGATNYRKRGL